MAFNSFEWQFLGSLRTETILNSSVHPKVAGIQQVHNTCLTHEPMDRHVDGWMMDKCIQEISAILYVLMAFGSGSFVCLALG